MNFIDNLLSLKSAKTIIYVYSQVSGQLSFDLLNMLQCACCILLLLHVLLEWPDLQDIWYNLVTTSYLKDCLKAVMIRISLICERVIYDFTVCCSHFIVSTTECYGYWMLLQFMIVAVALYSCNINLCFMVWQYVNQIQNFATFGVKLYSEFGAVLVVWILSLIHIWRCRRSTLCRSRWSPYH